VASGSTFSLAFLAPKASVLGEEEEVVVVQVEAVRVYLLAVSLV
jgi:hypothetical protein